MAEASLSSVPSRDGELCGVCLEAVSETCTLECGHSFHMLCALKWFRSPRSQGRCPLCRLRPPDHEALSFSFGFDAASVSDWNGSSDPNEFVEFSVAPLHRMFSPWIYSRRRCWDHRLQALVSSYMACRRRARNEQSSAEQDRADSNVFKSAHLLFAYLDARNLL